MPKSISTVRPSGRTMRLPPCRSPWNTPYNIAPSMNDTSPACNTASVSTPAACIACTSSHGMPSRRSITSTRRVTSVGCGRGTIVARCSVSASTRAMSSMFWASSRKSSSSTIVSANNSISAGGFASADTGMRPTRCGASHDIASMSSRTSRAICGRCTLTTTSSPVRSRAACTCAIDAAAIGVRSNDANTSSRERPSSSSTTRRTSSNDSGGTRSRSSLNSATSSSGKRPSPPETIWPSLMYVGPRCPNAMRRRRDRSRREYGGPLRRAPTAHRPSAPPTRRRPGRAGRAVAAGRSPSSAGTRPGPAPGGGRRRGARSWRPDRRPRARGR